MTINLSLDPDQSDAFTASLKHYFGDSTAEGFLERCVDNLIEVAAKGEFIRSPHFLYTSES